MSNVHVVFYQLYIDEATWLLIWCNWRRKYVIVFMKLLFKDLRFYTICKRMIRLSLLHILNGHLKPFIMMSNMMIASYGHHGYDDAYLHSCFLLDKHSLSNTIAENLETCRMAFLVPCRLVIWANNLKIVDIGKIQVIHCWLYGRMDDAIIKFL